jgi:peptidoglycan/LPS O-acetylase OafA/YrhL
MADDKPAAPTRDAPPTDTSGELKARMTTVFGWVAGGSLGLLVNYGLFLSYGEGYPTTPTTFVTFLAGAFAGMHLADRLGPRGFRPLGIAAGVLLVAFAWIVVAGLMSS